MTRREVLRSLAALALVGSALARPLRQNLPRPGFGRDVAPILRDRCIGCHNANLKSGGLLLDSFENLMKGGGHGPAIVPGRSGESRLVLMIKGRVAPRMPLGGELKSEEIAAIRAWIDGGAAPPETDEAPTPPAVIPEIRPAAPVTPPVTALAFDPRGRFLAAGLFEEIAFQDVTGRKTGAVKGPPDMVRALAISRDGKLLAAGGGRPAQSGEIQIRDLASRTLVKTLLGHSDAVFALAFSPDGSRLASSSYDRVAKLWDVATGKELRTFQEHNGPVYSVVFTPDGMRLVSASGDGTVKVWDTTTGDRQYTLSEATGQLYALDVHPSGKDIAAAGEDGTIRVWSLTGAGGDLRVSVSAHSGPVVRLAYSPDGRHLVSAGADRTVKVWSAESLVEIGSRGLGPDSILSLAVSLDGRRMAFGSYDGSITVTEIGRPSQDSGRPGRSVPNALHPAQARPQPKRP